MQNKPIKCTFSKLIFYLFMCRFLRVSNSKINLQEDGCIYNYGTVCFTCISISSLVGRRVCSIKSIKFLGVSSPGCHPLGSVVCCRLCYAVQHNARHRLHVDDIPYDALRSSQMFLCVLLTEINQLSIYTWNCSLSHNFNVTELQFLGLSCFYTF
jgi:hypothetical protein